MTYQQTIVETDGAVATVRLNNPERLNAMSPVMTSELVDAFEKLTADERVRAIVVTGEGRGFSSGADLSAFGDLYLAGERFRPSEFLRTGYNRLVPLMVNAPKPVIAAVNGIAAGAGVSLALACDYRMAAERASFSLAFVRIGLIPDAGSTYLLSRAVGQARALELALLSDRVDAAQALEMGLVNRVVPDDDLMKEALALAERLASLPTRAIALTKRAFDAASRATLADTLELETALQDEAADTHDHVEGVLAFLQKRPPSFMGQ
jgi:2-(1,2-epoxy-1,2-dihydrophenyl)acetyl-CoA isomerase